MNRCKPCTQSFKIKIFFVFCNMRLALTAKPAAHELDGEDVFNIGRSAGTENSTQ